ncbi:MAG: hypothetical protein WD894_16875 [Pirellulales bacterium]
MAKKLIDQEEAARLLGVSTDELNSMRDRKQVFPKRDAGVWKYELEQIQRLADERKSSSGGSWDDGSLELDDLSLEPDSIVLGDEPSQPGGSTVIGKNKRPQTAASDISESDVRLVSDSNVIGDMPKSKGGLLDDITADTSGSDDLFGSGSLSLAPEDLNLAGSGSSGRKGSASKKEDSALPLAEDDDEFVLGSKPESDITIGGSDSGISLVDPHDSGLSLEQPLQLGDSGADSFDLGDEDIISLDEDIAEDEQTQRKSDEDFLLTPIDDASDEPDSSSQVIALDAEEEFGGGFGSSPGMLEEDLTTVTPLVAPGLVPAAALAGAPIMTQGYEAPYSGWNIAVLVICFVFMFVGGMFMYDLMRHMWSWDSPYPWNGALIDSLAQYLP